MSGVRCADTTLAARTRMLELLRASAQAARIVARSEVASHDDADAAHCLTRVRLSARAGEAPSIARQPARPWSASRSGSTTGRDAARWRCGQRFDPRRNRRGHGAHRCARARHRALLPARWDGLSSPLPARLDPAMALRPPRGRSSDLIANDARIARHADALLRPHERRELAARMDARYASASAASRFRTITGSRRIAPTESGDLLRRRPARSAADVQRANRRRGVLRAIIEARRRLGTSATNSRNVRANRSVRATRNIGAPHSRTISSIRRTSARRAGCTART